MSPSATVSAGGATTTVPANCVTVTAAVPTALSALALIVAPPPPTAVTRPAESTTATSVSVLDQATVTPAIARPAWSNTSAENCAVWPRATNATGSGVTSIAVGSGATTVSSTRPLAPEDAAATSASPAATAVTKPAESTTATSVSLVVHMNSAPATGCPFASVASAVNRAVSPNATSVSAAGRTSTALTSCATVTAAVPDALHTVAVIVALPLATAVTRPAESTTATSVSLVVHMNSAPATGCPFASVASAVNRAVSPNATSVSAAGRTSTALTSCATVTAAVPDALHTVAVIVALPLATAVTRPAASTAATAASALDQLIAIAAIASPFWSRTSAIS